MAGIQTPGPQDSGLRLISARRRPPCAADSGAQGLGLLKRAGVVPEDCGAVRGEEAEDEAPLRLPLRPRSQPGDGSFRTAF